MEIQREFTWPERASRQWQLLNDFQRDFPLCAEPYAELARQMGGIGEEEILSQLKDWSQTGVLSRVGAVFRPQALGPSTLAAVKVCPPRLDEVAQFINSFSEVNHNYQREADLNLWFVVTAPTEERLQEVLLSIGEKAGFPVQDCRLLYEFRIDLGFSLMEEEPQADFNEQQAQGPAQLSDRQRQICRLLEEGLPLVTRPFDPWAKSLDLTTEELIQEIQTLVEQKIIRRFGLVLRHRPMGYQHNAMTVFRVPQSESLRWVGD